MSKFQLLTLLLFGFLGMVAVVIFSGLFDRGAAGKIGSITVWGTLSEEATQEVFTILRRDKLIDFEVEYVGIEEADFSTKLIEAIASAKGPDAVLLSEDLLLRYEDKIEPFPLASYPLRDFYDNFIDEARLFIVREGIAGMPLVVDPIVAYWNKDLFLKAGIPVFPKTWNQLATAVPLLVVKDTQGGIKEAAVALGSYGNVAHAKQILSSLFFQTGDAIIARTSAGVPAVSLNPDAAAAAFDFYTSFNDPTKNLYSWNTALPNSRAFFEAGKLAIYFGRASEYDDIRLKNPHLNFDVAELPQQEKALSRSTYGKLYGISVLKSTPGDRKPAAFFAAEILSSAEVLPFLAESIRLAPARRNALTQIPADPALAVFWRAASSARGWLDPDPVRTEGIFKSAIESLLAGQTAGKDVTLYLETQLSKLLSSYGRDTQ